MEGGEGAPPLNQAGDTSQSTDSRTMLTDLLFVKASFILIYKRVYRYIGISRKLAVKNLQLILLSKL